MEVNRIDSIFDAGSRYKKDRTNIPILLAEVYISILLIRATMK